MKEKSAVIYVRVSTKDQERLSPEAQLNSCRDYAQRAGLDIVKEFREARSGWKSNARIEFYKMVEFIEQNKIQNVVFAFGDRTGRNTEDYSLLKNTGVRFNEATSGISFCPNDPDDYELTANFEAGQVEAKRSSAKNRKRVTASQELKVQRGEYPAAPPLGYLVRPILIDGKPILIKGRWKTETIKDPERGDLIKKMFELYSTGEYSLHDITAKMEQLGLRPKRERGALLLEEISRYLKTPFYYGTFRWQEKLWPNKGTYPPIITKALFDEVQEILAGRGRSKTKGGKDFKYKGLLECYACGCAFIGDSHQRTIKTTGEIKTFTYYHCTSGKSKDFYREKFGQDKCPNYYGPYHSEKDLDGFFETAIESLYIDPDIYARIRKEVEAEYKDLTEMRADEAINLKRERSRIETKESGIIDEILGANPHLKKRYEAELENLDERKTAIEARLEELERGKSAVSLAEVQETLVLAKSFKDNYLSANPLKRAKYNHLMFSTVYVLPRDPREDYIIPGFYPLQFNWNEPFDSLFEKKVVLDDAASPVPEMPCFELKVPKNKEKRARRDSNSRPAGSKPDALSS